jgi:hypothetical protein
MEGSLDGPEGARPEVDPKLAIGDGALGFWKALPQVFGHTQGQRCWVHKTANVLNQLPKSQQPKAKAALQEIWMAASREEAQRAFDHFIVNHEAKYPKAVACLVKDREALTAFYDFPAEHWVHIRTTNPIDLRHGATAHCKNARLCITRQLAGHGLHACQKRRTRLAQIERSTTSGRIDRRGPVQKRSAGKQQGNRRLNGCRTQHLTITR